jgi:hypothetical protein
MTMVFHITQDAVGQLYEMSYSQGEILKSRFASAVWYSEGELVPQPSKFWM